MGTNLIRAMLLASASATIAATLAPTAVQAQEATYQIDIPAQPMDNALRALGKVTKQNIVFSGATVRGKRSVAVRGRMTASEALSQMLAGSGLKGAAASGGYMVQGGNAEAAPARAEAPAVIAQVSVSANASTVVDARTGAALKGALVEIVETGEKTSTGELGEFRFPGKSGSFELRISYLGYPEYQQFVDLKDGRATTGIVLSDGSATSDIIVTAYQSARAQALNQERAADNTSTVISSDLLGQFEGTTISEALRRAPGVSFEKDRLTGDGTNIVVRGLSSQFNTVALNGVRLPVGNGTDRSASLGNILADSVSKITINKTLLPSQDGSGTGALVEIETRGPLDRPARYFSVGAEYAKTGKQFLDEKLYTGTASLRFGAEKNFGLSASIQYRDRSINNIDVNNESFGFGMLPATDEGRPVFSLFDINPLRPFPFEAGADKRYARSFSISQNYAQVKNLGATLSAQWQIADHTDLRLDYNFNRAVTRSYSIFNDVNALADSTFLPVDSLGGEGRSVEMWEDIYAPDLPGRKVFAGLSGVVTGPNTEKTSTVSFRGSTKKGQWEVDYKLGYAHGSRTQTTAGVGTINFDFIDMPLTALLPEIAANTVNGRVVSLFGPAGSKIQYPGLTQEGYDLLNAGEVNTISNASRNTSKGQNERVTAAMDLKRNFSSFVEYLQGGLFFERSSNSNNPVSSIEYYPIGTVSLNDVGLARSSNPFNRIGVDIGLRGYTVDQLRDFVRRLESGDISQFQAQTNTPDPLQSQDFVKEKNYAAYLQSKIKLGKLEIVGGVRFERVDTRANVQSGPLIIDENGVFDQAFYDANRLIRSTSDSESSLVPRVMFNFRANENLVFRAGYYRSYARPSITQLGLEQQYQLVLIPTGGPAGNQPTLSVSRGNPGLKSSTTDNLDLSVEWYSRDIGVIKVGAFYKPTKKAFFLSEFVQTDAIDPSQLPDDPRFQNLPPNIYIINSKPENSDKPTKVWGFEVSVERKFDFLPGALGGLGVYSNYTYSDGSSPLVFPFIHSPTGQIEVSGLDYVGQPRHSGTAALTYSKYNIDASLAYTIKDRTLVAWRGFGLDDYIEAYTSLDFRLQYQSKIFGSDTRFYIEGADLLRSPRDAGQERSNGGSGTTPTFVRGATYYGGRSLRVGLSASF